MRASSAMSRVMSALFVMITTRSPGCSASTSRMPRVTLKCRSAGWYGSVAVPMTIGLALEQREMLVAAVAERAREDLAGVALDEDVSLEGEPRRDALDFGGGAVDEAVGGGCALHDVAMRVARVAVRASEGAADVRVDRPVAHPRDARCR